MLPLPLTGYPLAPGVTYLWRGQRTAYGDLVFAGTEYGDGVPAVEDAVMYCVRAPRPAKVRLDMHGDHDQVRCPSTVAGTWPVRRRSRTSFADRVRSLRFGWNRTVPLEPFCSGGTVKCCRNLQVLGEPAGSEGEERRRVRELWPWLGSGLPSRGPGNLRR